MSNMLNLVVVEGVVIGMNEKKGMYTLLCISKLKKTNISVIISGHLLQVCLKFLKIGSKIIVSGGYGDNGLIQSKDVKLLS